MIRKRTRYRLLTTRFIRRDLMQRSVRNIRRWWTRYSLHFEGISQYQKIWAPNLWQKLNIKREKTNLFYPYAVGLFCELKGKFESFTLARQLPGEIYRCCEYFLEHNGKLDVTVRSTKFHWSPLPQVGLEISIKLPVGEKKR